MVNKKYKKYAFPALMILALIVLGVSMQSGLLAGETDVSHLVKMDKLQYNAGEVATFTFYNQPKDFLYSDYPDVIQYRCGEGIPCRGRFPMYMANIRANTLTLEIAQNKLNVRDNPQIIIETTPALADYYGFYEIKTDEAYGTGTPSNTVFSITKSKEIIQFKTPLYLPAGNYTAIIRGSGTEGKFAYFDLWELYCGSSQQTGIMSPYLQSCGFGGQIRAVYLSDKLFASKTFEVLPSTLTSCPEGQTQNGQNCVVAINTGETCSFGQIQIGNSCLYPMKNYVENATIITENATTITENATTTPEAEPPILIMPDIIPDVIIDILPPPVIPPTCPIAIPSCPSGKYTYYDNGCVKGCATADSGKEIFGLGALLIATIVAIGLAFLIARRKK